EVNQKLEAEFQARVRTEAQRDAEFEAQRSQAEADLQRLASEAQAINSQVEELRLTQQEKAKQIEDARAALRLQEGAHLRAEAEALQFAQQQEGRLAELRETGKRLEAEAQRRHVNEEAIKAQIEANRAAETEQLKHLESLRAESEFAERKIQEHQAKIESLN